MNQKMMKNSILYVLLVLLTASCAALGKYKPVTTAPEDLYGNLELSDTASNIANFKWQEFFTDPKLQVLIDSALARNLDMQMSLEHIKQAEAQILGAKLAYVPTLGITPTFNAKFPGGGSTTYSYDIAVSSSWQMDFFRLTNNLKSAKVSKEQMEDLHQAVRSQLVASMANAYYTLLMLDAEMATSKEMVDTWEKSVQTVIALKDAGQADEVAVNQYRANYEKMKITVVDLKTQIDEVENSIALMMNQTPDMEIDRGTLVAQEAVDVFPIGVPVQMLTLRPDVRSAQRDMELAHYTTRGALLNFFPTLSINGSFGLVNPASGALSPMSTLGTVGADLVAPILNAGKNKAAYDAAKSRQRESQLKFQQTLLNAGHEVNNAMHSFQDTREMTEFYIVQVKSLDKARYDTEYLMKNSQDKTYLDVLYAYNEFFSAKLAMIGNRAKEFQALVSLYSALGGGSI